MPHRVGFAFHSIPHRVMNITHWAHCRNCRTNSPSAQHRNPTRVHPPTLKPTNKTLPFPSAQHNSPHPAGTPPQKLPAVAPHLSSAHHRPQKLCYPLCTPPALAEVTKPPKLPCPPWNSNLTPNSTPCHHSSQTLPFLSYPILPFLSLTSFPFLPTYNHTCCPPLQFPHSPDAA